MYGSSPQELNPNLGIVLTGLAQLPTCPLVPHAAIAGGQALGQPAKGQKKGGPPMEDESARPWPLGSCKLGRKDKLVWGCGPHQIDFPLPHHTQGTSGNCRRHFLIIMTGGGGGVTGIWWAKVKAINTLSYNAQDSLPITE